MGASTSSKIQMKRVFFFKHCPCRSQSLEKLVWKGIFLFFCFCFFVFVFVFCFCFVVSVFVCLFVCLFFVFVFETLPNKGSFVEFYFVLFRFVFFLQFICLPALIGWITSIELGKKTIYLFSGYKLVGQILVKECFWQVHGQAWYPLLDFYAMRLRWNTKAQH